MTNQVTILAQTKDAASGPLGKIRKSSDELGKSAVTTNSKLGGLGKGLVNVGKVALVGMAALVAGAALAGKELLGLSAKLEQTRAKVQTVFGKDEAGDVKDWADEVATRMGLTSIQAQGLAANFGDLLIPMKFTRRQASDMATEVVGLAGALSEWSGGQRTAEEVASILAKAMLGERDSLKELGISITEADVKARLLKSGQDKLTGSALEQAKAVATQQLIFEKSADAQAAYAKGSGTLLGKQAQLRAKFGEFTEHLATGLTPVFHGITTFLVDQLIPAAARIIGKVQAWVEANRPLISQITKFVGGVLSTLVTVGGRVVEMYGRIIGAITSNKDAMNFLRTVVGAIATGFDLVTTAAGFVVGRIAAFVDKVSKNKPLIEFLRSVVASIARQFELVAKGVGIVLTKFGELSRWIAVNGPKLRDLVNLLKFLPGPAGQIGQLGIEQRQHGGPVRAGQTVLVGERRPELFRPSVSGTIIPRVPRGSNGGGGMVIHTHLHLDGRQIAEVVDRVDSYAAGRAPQTRRIS